MGLRRKEAMTFKKKIKKLGKGVPVGNILENGTSRPLIGQEATSRPHSGREVPRGTLREFLICEEVPVGPCRGIPPNHRAGCCPEGHPALWSGGRAPRLYKPQPAPKISFYPGKIRKKRKREEKERRGRGEAVFTRRFGGIFSFKPYNYLKITII
jgi:hypothetical protein